MLRLCVLAHISSYRAKALLLHWKQKEDETTIATRNILFKQNCVLRKVVTFELLKAL